MKIEEKNRQTKKERSEKTPQRRKLKRTNTNRTVIAFQLIGIQSKTFFVRINRNSKEKRSREKWSAQNKNEKYTLLYLNIQITLKTETKNVLRLLSWSSWRSDEFHFIQSVSNCSSIVAQSKAIIKKKKLNKKWWRMHLVGFRRFRRLLWSFKFGENVCHGFTRMLSVRWYWAHAWIFTNTDTGQVCYFRFAIFVCFFRFCRSIDKVLSKSARGKFRRLKIA